jgi:hypothetical protein
MSVNWDGNTRPEKMAPSYLEPRVAFADAAKSFDWIKVMSMLKTDPGLVNLCRPGSKSLFAPLHQAANSGASEMVVRDLINAGAWRTLQNSRGERAVDVAERKGHTHLLPLLEPVFRHCAPMGVLLKIQTHFHAVIQGRVDELVQEHQLKLPELEPLLELDNAEMWFPVAGMYGGFCYRLETFGVEAKLVVESWCRVAGGSGQRHEITSKGSQLVAEGFV